MCIVHVESECLGGAGKLSVMGWVVERGSV
jgi:hypothetical protein